MVNVLISTLICTYNAEGFVTKTLDSVISQTYKNQEILFWDDGSKDKTVQILQRYARKDKRIRIYTSQQEGKKLGPYGGLNFLLDKAKGKYIAIQDHDDIWHPQKLQKQISFLEKNPKYIGCGTGTLMYFGISKVGYFVDNISKNTNNVIHTSLVFRNQGFKYDIVNDFLGDRYFMKNILCKGGKKIKIIPDILTLHYYKETGNNYSEQWFKINMENVKRYFCIYGFNIVSIAYFFYLFINKTLPYSIGNFITFNITLKNKLILRNVLEKQYNCVELLKYY